MSDELRNCKICGVWQQQSNPAERCCDGCGDDPRKLHGYIHRLEQRLSAAEARIDSDYKEAKYLFSLCAPQCNALPDTSGVLSQLSNYIAGLTQDIAKAEAERDEARKALANSEAWTAQTTAEIREMARRVKDLSPKVDQLISERDEARNRAAGLEEDRAEVAQERDEAREAAWWCFDNIADPHAEMDAETRWPWLANETTG